MLQYKQRDFFRFKGLNKHFHMACIQHKLQHSAGLFLTTKQIWEHLKTLYDLDSLVSIPMCTCSVIACMWTIRLFVLQIGVQAIG